MDTGRDSVDLLRKLLDTFGGKLDLVVVKNEIRGNDFHQLEQSGELARAQELGARVVEIRRLHDATMQKIDGQSSSFWSAIHPTNPSASLVGILERQRVKSWLAKTYSELERAGA